MKQDIHHQVLSFPEKPNVSKQVRLPSIYDILFLDVNIFKSTEHLRDTSLSTDTTKWTYINIIIKNVHITSLNFNFLSAARYTPYKPNTWIFGNPADSTLPDSYGEHVQDFPALYPA